MDLAPIVLFVYSRIWHTKQTVESLRKNKLAKDSELFIFSDGPKENNKVKNDVEKVREYIKTIDGFKHITIVEREKNYGLANSIISGVTEIVNKYGKIIVLEDDLIVSIAFLGYMNYYLNFYKDEQKVFSITGFNYPYNLLHIPKDYDYSIYFNYRCMSWSWATWVDRWNSVDWFIKDYNKFKNDRKAQKLFNRGGDDLTNMLRLQIEGKIDSWAIRWCYAHFINNAYCVYPVKSLVNNIGHDGTGVHSGKTDKYTIKIFDKNDNFRSPPKIEISKAFVNQVKNIHKCSWKILIKRLIRGW